MLELACACIPLGLGPFLRLFWDVWAGTLDGKSGLSLEVEVDCELVVGFELGDGILEVNNRNPPKTSSTTSQTFQYFSWAIVVNLRCLGLYYRIL